MTDREKLLERRRREGLGRDCGFESHVPGDLILDADGSPAIVAGYDFVTAWVARWLLAGAMSSDRLEPWTAGAGGRVNVDRLKREFLEKYPEFARYLGDP